MITTVTLNVAVDKLYTIDEIQIGEVNRVKECNATAGGKGLNVARVASILKEDVIATGFIGGYSGLYVQEMLNADGIKSDFVSVDGETRTCINIVDKSGKSTEFLEPGVIVSDINKHEFISKYEQIAKISDTIVLSGSLPRGCDSNFYVGLISIGKEYNCKVILDTSGENLKQGIIAKPTMIKPNKNEMEALCGVNITNKEDIIKAALKLHGGGIPYVVVSLGKNGAILACDNGVFEGNPPEVKVVNTVGCGDSMVAAFAVAFERKYSVEKALQFALAVSSANAMCKQTGFLYPKNLAEIINSGKVTKLI